MARTPTVITPTVGFPPYNVSWRATLLLDARVGLLTQAAWEYHPLDGGLFKKAISVVVGPWDYHQFCLYF